LSCSTASCIPVRNSSGSAELDEVAEPDVDAGDLDVGEGALVGLLAVDAEEREGDQRRVLVGHRDLHRAAGAGAGLVGRPNRAGGW
jgi:hypothetical protein